MSVVIAGLGACAPMGTTPTQIVMAARARLLVPRPLPWRDRRGRYMGACTAIGINRALVGYDRLLALAAAAAWPACATIDDPLPLLLALPEPLGPHDDARLDGAVLADLAVAAMVPLDIKHSRVFRAGHAGGALAVGAALEMLAAPGGPTAVLVGGVDSWVHPELLRWLDAECRLHGLDVDDGFIPSEAAAFLLLRTHAKPQAVTVRQASTDREDSVLRDPRQGDAPNIARAMTALVHGCTASARAPIRWVLSDVNGERHRVGEWAKVELRALDGEVDHLRVPDVLGDIGAATGTMAAVLAAVCWQTNCAPAREALVALHSDGADRGVILLEAHSSERGPSARPPSLPNGVM